jgi:hypothetical protein
MRIEGTGLRRPVTGGVSVSQILGSTPDEITPEAEAAGTRFTLCRFRPVGSVPAVVCCSQDWHHWPVFRGPALSRDLAREPCA